MAKVEFTTGQIVDVLEGAGYRQEVNPRELVKYKVDSYNGTSVYLRPVDDKFPHHKPIRFNRRTLMSEKDFLRSASRIIADPVAYFASLDKAERLRELRQEVANGLTGIDNIEVLERLLETVNEFGGKKK